MRNFIFRCPLSLGDIVLLTAAVRDLQLHFPDSYRVDVRTCFPDLWSHNPYLTPLGEYDPEVKVVDCVLPLINQSRSAACHAIHGFIDFLNRYLGASMKPTAFHGDIHLSRREKAGSSPIQELTGADLPFWLICAGGKYDCTIKWWDVQRYQEVVDHFRGCVQFVQVGDPAHYHPKLSGVIDLRGRTSIRELIRLVHHAEGVLCGVTGLMHLAAAVPVRRGRYPERPCVVVAGGRESPHWEAYPGHQFIHTVGALPCCARGGCWKARTIPLGDGDERDNPERLCVDVRRGLPRCMDMISTSEVVRRMETYFEGSVARYLTAAEARAAETAVAATRNHTFSTRPLNFHTAPELAERWLTTSPLYPGDFAGSGIVICGGGVRMFTNAWVCIRMLRHLGCPLPIELWHFGERELDARMRALVKPLGVECIDAKKKLDEHPARLTHMWALKPYAVVHCRFREVLLLDADNVPVANPEPLFDSPEFRKTGAVFWPDFGRLQPGRSAWKLFDVPYRDEPEFESGQVLVNKEACWRALNLCLWYNQQADLVYGHVHGDKETFHLAFRKLNAPYSMPVRRIYRLPDVMCQHDFQGRRLFQHRNGAKWNLFGPNRRIRGFWLETECRQFLKDLAASWNGQIKKLSPPPPRGATGARVSARDRVVRIFAALVAKRDDESARQLTLVNLAATDWACLPVHVQWEERRFSASEENTTHAASLALRAGARSHADYVLLLTGDLEFNRYFWHNLQAWPLLRRYQLDLGTLINPGFRELSRFPADRARAVDSRYGFCSRALLLSRRAVRFLLHHWPEGPASLDQKIGTLAAGWGRPVFCHWPSLVRVPHGHSLVNGVRPAADFKRDWRAVGPNLAQFVALSSAEEAAGHGP
jgi:ADP-heptose:LPS heptosyltransferase